MKNPNFFIIGAPKSGTTALYQYLKEHPQCYFPKLKEPCVFNDEDEGRYVLNVSTYLSLYNDVSRHHKAIGDCSVLYLASRSAVKRLFHHYPFGKLIVILRHPVDMFFSLHQQNLFRLREVEKDPVKAWELQIERARGNKIPKGCRAHQLLQYKHMISLGTQMEKLFQVYVQEKVLVLSFNEFVTDTKKIYEQTLEYLELEQDGRTSFPKKNSSKIHRSSLFARMLAPTAYIKTPVFGKLLSASRKGTGRNLVFLITGFLEFFRRMNTKPWHPIVDPVFLKQLQEEMAPEVKKVHQLTGILLRSKYSPE